MDNTSTPTFGVQRRFNEACVLGFQQLDNRTEIEAINNVNNNQSTTNTSFGDNNSDVERQMPTFCSGEPACSGNGQCNNGKCDCNPGVVNTL